MCEPGTDVPNEQRRREWLDRLIAEFVKLEPLMPIKMLPEGEYPQWVLNVEREFGAAVLSTMKIKDGVEKTPKTLGALLGHQCAFAVWMMEWAEHEAGAEEIKTLEGLNESQINQLEHFSRSLGEGWYGGLRRLAKRALCSSVDQTYQDMSEFLQAYTKAFASKPRTFGVGELGNPTFEIYLFLLLTWRAVERFRSVRELHSVLIKGLGRRVGDLKRVEKICQRMGLSFRKPGRPAKVG